MRISWVNHLYDNDKPCDTGCIKILEQELGIVFPIDYLEEVRNNQGKAPARNTIMIGPLCIGVSHLLLVSESTEYPGSTIKFNHECIKDYIHKNIVPIFGTGGGSVFAFDYRESKTNPKVVYISSESIDVVFVSNSFSEFVSKLH